MTPILPILATVLLVAATFAASPPVTLRVDRLPLAVRGGGGKEWVCNGGVCELKEIPKKTSAAKKESSSEAKKAVTADDTGDKPGWLQQLKPLAVRGGGSKEWVCDGDVCELKPASKKKSKAKKGASSKASKAVSSDSSDNEPGWLQSLRTLVGGSRVSPLQRGLSFVAKLFGVDINSALVDEKEDGGKDDAPSVAAPGASKVPKKKQTKALSRAEQRAMATKERGARGGRGGRAGRGGARAASSSALRIQRELRDFQTNPPPHCSVAVRPDNLNVWIITLAGVEDTVYAGEKYKLRVEVSFWFKLSNIFAESPP